MKLRLMDFKQPHAATILAWLSDAEEMKAWAGRAAPFPAPADLFQRWHAEPDVHPVLLLAGEDVTGYGEIWVDRDESEIELGRVIIAPARRGQGYGQKFIRLLLQRAATFDLPHVFVRVIPENGTAIRCYQRVGFVRASAMDEHRYNRVQPRPYVWMELRNNPLANSD